MIKINQIKCEMGVPVCTRCPFCSSDIVTDSPFSRETLAVDGKHPPLEQSQLSPPSLTHVSSSSQPHGRQTTFLSS